MRISVSDTGPGIPESELQRVFEPFTQVDGGPTRTFNGAGIGLAVAHEIVELMGGRILLESVVGEGSVFTIELPLPSAGRSREAVEIPRAAATVLLVGPPSPSRLSLEAWGREVGATVETADGPDVLDGDSDAQPDLVIVLDEGNADAELRVARRIGSTGEEVGRLSQPVMPSTFLRLLSEAGVHGAGTQSAEPQDRGSQGVGPPGAAAEDSMTADTAASRLLHRFPPSELDTEQLHELAVAAGEVRATSEGGSALVDEMLFRVSLTARRGDLETTRERLTELGQMRLNQYNDER